MFSVDNKVYHLPTVKRMKIYEWSQAVEYKMMYEDIKNKK